VRGFGIQVSYTRVHWENKRHQGIFRDYQLRETSVYGGVIGFDQNLCSGEHLIEYGNIIWGRRQTEAVYNISVGA
jgi:hypothetical protein